MNKKVKTSNFINRLGCGSELLYCTRVYVNARIYGGAWIPMEYFLNFVFYLLRGQKNHVRAAYLWERRYAKTKTLPPYKSATEEAQEAESNNETSQNEG